LYPTHCQLQPLSAACLAVLAHVLEAGAEEVGAGVGAHGHVRGASAAVPAAWMDPPLGLPHLPFDLVPYSAGPHSAWCEEEEDYLRGPVFSGGSHLYLGCMAAPAAVSSSLSSAPR
jgi:hypothetical protein